MGFSMSDFAPLYMTSQLAGVFDVSFAAANGMENDELSNLLRIPMLLKKPATIVEALYWIDDIISKAEDGENKSLLLSQAYEEERLMLPPALAELPEEPNRNVDELAYAYWLGYIYRCECLLHEEWWIAPWRYALNLTGFWWKRSGPQKQNSRKSGSSGNLSAHTENN